MRNIIEIFRKNKDIFIPLFLFIIFFSTYFIIGYLVSNTFVFHRDANGLIGDVRRVIGDLSVFGADHYRTKVHPLFVLFLNPFGSFLTFFVGANLSAVLLNSFFGAINVILFYFLMKKIGLYPFYSIFFSILLGLSTSQFIFGSIPQTFIFSSVSLILLFLVILDKKLSLLKYGAVTIFSFGMATTNIILSVLLFCGKFYKEKLLRFIKLFFKFFTIVFIIALLLSIIQNAIYPSSNIFIFSSSYTEDLDNYLHLDNLINYSRVIYSIPYFTLYNIIAPNVGISFEPHYVGIFFNDPKGFNIIEIFYLAFLLFSAWLIIKNKIYTSPIFISALSFFLFSFLFFQVYGDSWFIYSPLYTFIFILLVAMPYKIKMNGMYDLFLKSFLVLLIILISINNISFIQKTILLYNSMSI